MNDGYPVRFSVDFPDHDLDRLTTALRIFTVIPIAIVLGAIGGYSARWGTSTAGTTEVAAAGGTGLLFVPPLLMIVFRQKYPRWWFDWNLQLLGFANRVGVYLALMDDRYPSTDEEQSVHLAFDYPDARAGLNRWLPLVKWLLAIPHYVVLFFLYIGVFFAAIAAWFATHHAPIPARDLRLHRGCHPLAQPRDRLRADPGHRRLPSVPAERLKTRRPSLHHQPQPRPATRRVSPGHSQHVWSAARTGNAPEGRSTSRKQMTQRTPRTSDQGVPIRP